MRLNLSSVSFETAPRISPMETTEFNSGCRFINEDSSGFLQILGFGAHCSDGMEVSYRTSVCGVYKIFPRVVIRRVFVLRFGGTGGFRYRGTAVFRGLTVSRLVYSVGERGETVRLNCPSCGGEVVAPEGLRGERVCSACGLVLSKIPTAKAGFVQWNPVWHSNWREGDSETLKEWLTALRTVSCQLGLPSFPYREEAARRIRRERQVFFRSQRFGKNKRITVAALLHEVLRQYNKDRSLKEMCKQLSLDSKHVIKQSWALNRSIIDNHCQLTDFPRKTCTDYLFENGGKVTSDPEVLREAEDALMTVRKTGGNPVALASGALYHVCKNRKIKISKRQIGEAFKVSHRTVYTNEVRIRTLLRHVGTEKNLTGTPRKIPLLTISQKAGFRSRV